MKIIFATLLITFSFTASATGAYKCTVSSTAGLNQNGKLSQTEFTKLSLASEFVVDKGTGRINGGKFSNHNSFGQPQVLEIGSSEQAFKALTIFKPNPMINYLYIEEFSEKNEKPFMFVDGSNIYSGICIPY